MKMNFVCPNLSHISEYYWNQRLKKFNIDFTVKYGYPSDINQSVIVSDTEILNPNVGYKNLYGWIIESPFILEYFHSGYFNKVITMQDKFIKIYTHNKNLLGLSDKFIFYPHGDCTIEDYDKLNKTKLVSMISSNKNWVPGHKLRLEIIKNYSNRFDLYGRGHNPIDKKEFGLNEYCFSLAIENCKEDYYFTEKIIDCFRTKTIPIYWGCPSIGDFFDKNGIITFDTIDELNYIFNTLSQLKYYDLIESVEKNYQLSFKYDTFFNNFKYTHDV